MSRVERVRGGELSESPLLTLETLLYLSISQFIYLIPLYIAWFPAVERAVITVN